MSGYFNFLNYNKILFYN